jgi:hypothetical protein
MIVNASAPTSDGCGGGRKGRPRQPATAPPVGGSPGLPLVYFDGVMHSVNDSSPKTNVPQFPDTDRSSNRSPGPKRSPTATVYTTPSISTCA